MNDLAQPTVRQHFADLLGLLRGESPPAPPGQMLLASHTDQPVAELPVSRYTDEAFCQHEQARLFRRLPLVLEAAVRIAPGEVLAHEATGLPLLITRDDDRLRVFLNQCRHRGTRLLAGDAPCARRRLVCPYHNWTYALDGRLLSLPQPGGFAGLDRAAHGLVELPSAVRHGLLFAVPDPAAELDIDPWLDGAAAYLDELDTGRYVFYRHSARDYACNWKLPIDAFLEAYHLHRLHKDTLAPLFADNLALARQHGSHLSAAVARSNVREALELPPAAWDLRGHVTFSVYLLPNTVLIYHPDYLSLVRFWPLAAGRCRIEHSMLIPAAPASEAAEAHWQRAWQMTDEQSFAAEDFHICEEIQAGLAAGAQQAVLLGSYEQSIARFHALLDRLAG